MANRSRADGAATKPRSRREKRRYNGRSSVAVAVRTLTRELTAALGNVSMTPVLQSAIWRASELGVIASELRARRLRGEEVDIAEIVKAENAYRRAVVEIGVKPGAAGEPAELDPLEYARRHDDREGAP